MSGPSPTLVRPETVADIGDIRRVHLAAFPTPSEAALVDRLRRDGPFDPSLSLVAERDGHIVGHALLTPVGLLDDEGDDRALGFVLALGPVAVLPADQRTGAGTALCRDAVRVATERRVRLIIVLGHPGYYPRFGFEPARPLGISPPEDWPDATWMARRLDGWDQTLCGTVRYPPPFADA